MWRLKGLVLIVVAVVLAAAWWSLSNAPDDYESRAKVALLPDSANPELVPFYGQAVENLLPTYAEIVESQTFLDEIARRLPFETTGSELEGEIRADPVSGIGVLDIIATSPDPGRAQQVARATAEGLVRRLAGNGIVDVSLLDEPRLPTETTAPSAGVVLTIGLLMGVLFGCAAAISWDRFFARVNTPDELGVASGLPVLGVLPETRRMDQRRIVIGEPGLFELEESLRSLRTNLLFATGDDGGGPTIVTALNPGDGKSMVAANLAILTAELGMSVLLVDADLYRPVQHQVFGVSNEIGLSSIVEFGLSPEDVVVSTHVENLRLVPAGPPIASRAKELRVYLETMADFSTMADVIIVDSPPLRAGDEVRLLAAFSRRVVLLVRAGSVSARDLQHSVDSLRSIGGDVLGLVLTRAEHLSDDAMKHYRYYRDPGESAPSASSGLEQGSGNRGRSTARLDGGAVQESPGRDFPDRRPRRSTRPTSGLSPLPDRRGGRPTQPGRRSPPTPPVVPAPGESAIPEPQVPEGSGPRPAPLLDPAQHASAEDESFDAPTPTMADPG